MSEPASQASASYVRALYRLLLQRDPESEAVVADHLRSGDDIELLRRFVESPEFHSRLTRNAIGRHVYETDCAVAIEARPEQLQQMLDGIRVSWQQFGERAPHWSVLTDDKFAPGAIDRHIDEFYGSGESAIALAIAALRRAGIDPGTLTSAMDFGCGVGRLTFALSPHFERVTGIDISPGHIALAEQRGRATGTTNVGFRQIASVEQVSTLPEADFVLSLIVLQHNPPPVMADLLRRLLRLLRPGGCAYVQLPTFIQGYRFAVDDYLGGVNHALIDGHRGAMEMNCLPQAAVFAIARDSDCHVLEVREDAWAGDARMVSHSFLFQRAG